MFQRTKIQKKYIIKNLTVKFSIVLITFSVFLILQILSYQNLHAGNIKHLPSSDVLKSDSLVCLKKSKLPLSGFSLNKPLCLEFMIRIEQIDRSDSCGVEIGVQPQKSFKKKDNMGVLYSIREKSAHRNWSKVKINFYLPREFKEIWIAPINACVTIKELKVTEIKDDSSNLVINPNFDIFSLLPSQLNNEINGLHYWNKIENSCVEQRTDFRVNYAISATEVIQNPLFHFGTPDFIVESIKDRNINCSGRVVCYAKRPSLTNSFAGEYFQTRLKQKMKMGKKYLVSFDYRLDDYSRKVCNSLGIKISKCALNPGDKEHFVDNIPPIPTCLVNDSLLMNTDWQKFEFIYEANGEEEFFTVGKFSKTGRVLVGSLPISKKGRFNDDAVYLIDNVVVRELND